uniref:Uncharacterized protein n=1 Tax=Oryzias sinensis TaxID=183150 RepID=A0A8C7Y5K7_9TELE
IKGKTTLCEKANGEIRQVIDNQWTPEKKVNSSGQVSTLFNLCLTLSGCSPVKTTSVIFAAHLFSSCTAQCS